MISGVFVLFFLKIMWIKKWGNCSDPQLDPHGEMRGKSQRALGRKFAFLSGAFEAVSLLLHYLCHEAAHSLRRLILHLPGGVGIGAQGEPRIVVAQHTGHCLDVHPILQGQRGEGVA